MSQEDCQYNLLVYGIEKVGLTKPSQDIVNHSFKLCFEPFKTQKRFSDFDGVILFQGIFEEFKTEHDWTGKPYLKNFCDHGELDKRTNELNLLLEKGGFVCFILNKEFIDTCSSKIYSNTDLCKIALNNKGINRNNFKNRLTSLHCRRDEFTNFIKLYGAASSYFTKSYAIEWREIADFNNQIVGMVLFERMFFVPSLIPNTNDHIIEYFNLLTKALTASFNKLRIDIPLWAAKFSFEKENELLERKTKLLDEIEIINKKIQQYNQYKKVILGSGEILVENVATLLRDGFSFRIDSKDEYKEDIKIIDENNNSLVLIEVKGTNRGVKREHINQTDSHRERAGLASDFPSLLVINTHIKDSNNMEHKDKVVPKEQIKHAVKMNILILRTLDLLYLLRHLDNSKISRQSIMDIFCSEVGWLKVDSDGWKIINFVEIE